jgi:ParB family transcriptional regulator, chromosome partitioning protein
MSRNALGRGLGALIREAESPVISNDRATDSPPQEPPASRMSASQLVDIDLIDPSPYQPRTRFREDSLAELAQSIRASGIIQPLVLRPIGSRFQLLAGERRWRAAQRAGLDRVPAVLREVNDAAAMEITIVENIQREDLNAIEEARAFERLINEFHLTQEDVAARTGKDRTSVANAVRLLRLEKPVLDLIEDGRISAGHGRALLAISDPKLRLAMSQRAARGGLTVRQIERLATRRNRATAAPTLSPPLDANTRAALEQLQQSLGTRVTLRLATKTRPGELVIEYYDEGQLTQLYDRLMG